MVHKQLAGRSILVRAKPDKLVVMGLHKTFELCFNITAACNAWLHQLVQHVTEANIEGLPVRGGKKHLINL